jgi:hypothetical protein
MAARLSRTTKYLFGVLAFFAGVAFVVVKLELPALLGSQRGFRIVGMSDANGFVSSFFWGPPRKEQQQSENDPAPAPHAGCDVWLDPKTGRYWGDEPCARRDGLVLSSAAVAQSIRFVDRNTTAALFLSGGRWPTEAEFCGNDSGSGSTGARAFHVLRVSGIHPDAVRRHGATWETLVHPPEVEAAFPAHRYSIFRFGTIPPLRPDIFPEVARAQIDKSNVAASVGFTLCVGNAAANNSSFPWPSGSRISPVFTVVNYYKGPLYSSPTWGKFPGAGKEPQELSGCAAMTGVTCLSTEDPAREATADVVTVYAGEGWPMSVNRVVLPGFRGQWFSMHLWESASSRAEALTNVNYIEQFRVSSTMSLRSTFPQFFSYDLKKPPPPPPPPPPSSDGGAGNNGSSDRAATLTPADVAFNVVPVEPERRVDTVLALFSTCKTWSQRTERLRDLIRAFPRGAIKSFGKCEHNAEWPAEYAKHEVYSAETGETYRTIKAQVQARFKFELVMQNSVCLDFIDEKLYDALRRGTIPIYYGAPNVLDYLPKGFKMIIRWEDYASDAELVADVMRISRDRAALAEFHRWREQLPLTLPPFAPRVSGGAGPAWDCGTCGVAVFDRIFQPRSNDDVDKQAQQPHRPLPQPDRWCCDDGSKAGCKAIAAVARRWNSKRFPFPQAMRRFFVDSNTTSTTRGRG